MRETATLVNQVKVAKLFEKPNGYCIWDNPITVPEAIKKMKIPIKDKNKMEVSYIKQRVQGQILLYQKLQFKNMGRLLLCIKMAEGKFGTYDMMPQLVPIYPPADIKEAIQYYLKANN